MEQKDTQQENTSFNGQPFVAQANSAFVNKHSMMSVIVKKTEKILTAIYMVTDFISDSEPLRMRLRTLALGISTDTRKMHARSAEPHTVLASDIGRTTDEIVSLITLSATIGLISEMNGTILIKELEKVREEIDRAYGEKKVSVTTHPGYSGILLSESFFQIEQSAEKILQVEHKGHFNSKGHEEIASKNESFLKKGELGIKIARRNNVLNVIKSKGKVSIKDITSILKDTSEKTVQRELLTLVHEGVLVKEGEKRWSTYRIAQ